MRSLDRNILQARTMGKLNEGSERAMKRIYHHRETRR